MKLLFDQNISYRLLAQIKDLYPDAKHISQLGLENSSDKQIWEYARSNHYMLVTFDADFYDFSVFWGHPPKIIWLRTFDQTTKKVNEMLRKHFDTLVEFQENAALACLEIIYKG